MPKISVIVPVYNGEKFISKCLDSLLSQNLSDIEIIVINDGSIDKTENIVKQRALSDTRITLISQENSGVSSARNRGIRAAKGDYIAFCDSDDIFDCDFLEKLYTLGKKENLDIVKGSTILVDATGKERIDPENSRIVDISDFNSKWFSAIYRRELLSRFNITFPEEISYKEDTVFLFKSKLYAKSFQKIDDTFYHYNFQRSDSLSNNVSEKSIKDAFKNLLIRVSILNHYFSDNPGKIDYSLYKNIINNSFAYFAKYSVMSLGAKAQEEIATIIREILLHIKDKNNSTKNILSDKKNEAILRYYSNLEYKNYDYWGEIKKLLDKEASSVSLDNLKIEHKGRLRIRTDHFDVETFLVPKFYEKLYVFLSGVGHWDTAYPFFERTRWSKDLKGISLFFDDPTRVQAKLDLPYYFGSKENDCKDEILKIVLKICSIHNINFQNVVFIGHSNAGYAAIYLADKLKGSLSISFCPQFSIKKFLDNKNNDFEKFKKQLGIKDEDISNFDNRLSIENLVNNRNNASRFLVYSNLASTVDLLQLGLIDEFKDVNEIKPDFYKFNNVLIWAVNIKCARPHQAWPDQHVSMYLEALANQEFPFSQRHFLKLIEAEMFKIEMEKDLKNEAISKLNKIKKSVLGVLAEI